VTATPTAVLDSSAVIAFLFGEDGADPVGIHLFGGGAVIGTGNWSEIAQKVNQTGQDWPAAQGLLSGLARLEPVTVEDAETAASLWETGSNLSLGDRLCLALGSRLGLPVLTADKAWDGRTGIELIR
jgi:PIN domain nuclease of toxin-antitoxin system